MPLIKRIEFSRPAQKRVFTSYRGFVEQNEEKLRRFAKVFISEVDALKHKPSKTETDLVQRERPGKPADVLAYYKSYVVVVSS